MDESPQSAANGAFDADSDSALNEAVFRTERARTLPGVSSLNFKKLAGLDRLPDMRGLGQIKRLQISGTRISRLDEVARLSNLETLQISSTQIKDLGPISGLVNLKTLNIQNTDILSLAPLRKLTALQRLSLSFTNVDDLSPLRDLFSLQRLECQRSSVTDLSPLSALIALRRLDVSATRVSDLSALAGLTSLRILVLGRTRVSDISSLQGMFALERLDIRSTKVEDLAPITHLENLRRLDIRGTAVSDISALERLNLLEALNLSSTLVEDLSPLANSLRLIWGAQNPSAPGGLDFSNCPISDDVLRRFAKAANPERTIRAIEYLRREIGEEDETVDFESTQEDDFEDWEKLDPANLDEDDEEEGDQDFDLALRLESTGELIPAQITSAISFTSASEGPLDILPDPIEQPIDLEQAELYERMRRQLRTILDEVPSQELGQVVGPIEDFLQQPDRWENVRFKKILWLCGNALRNVLSQHDAVAGDLDPHYAKLPPALAEAFRRPIETWNIVVLGDPSLRDLDSQRLGPRDVEPTRQQLESAEEVVRAAASNRRITTPEAGAAIEAARAAADTSADNIHTRQAQLLAKGTSQNLIVQILRGAHRVATDLRDPKTQEAQNFVKEYKSGIYKKLGEWTATATVAATATTATAAVSAAYFYGIPFLEFVVAHGPWLKAYLGVAFQNPQLLQIVDVISEVRTRIVRVASSTWP